MMRDFIPTSKTAREITEVIQGKTVIRFDVPDTDMDDFIVFHFTDGSALRIRYDWIYEWELQAPAKTESEG